MAEGGISFSLTMPSSAQVFDFTADIDLAGGVVSNQDDGKAGLTGELGNTGLELFKDFVADALAVQNLGHFISLEERGDRLAGVFDVGVCMGSRQECGFKLRRRKIDTVFE